MSKFTNKEVNVLYFPSLSALDLTILDIPVNYFGNSNIKHPNLTNLSELTWLNYDFIFTHHLDDTIINLSNVFHIPILYYVNNKTKIDKSFPKNIIFLYDTLSPDQIPNTICINLINKTKTFNIDNKKDCLFINYHRQKLDDKTTENIKSNLPDATIIDSLPGSLNELSEIFAQYKVCVDMHQCNIHDSILSIKNRCVYIGFYNKNNVFEHKYENLYYVDNINYDAYEKLIQFYNPNQFNKDIKTIDSNINNNAAQDLSSVYSLLKFRRFIV
jgi:hypothetical protein